MTLPTLHMIGLFHTICDDRFSHCAFTGKVRRFAKMMQRTGYRVVEYSNGHSQSEAHARVTLLDEAELRRLIGPEFDDRTIGHVNHAHTDREYFWLFHARLKLAMHEAVKEGDIICHPFGDCHRELLERFPQARHVETGIGYDADHFGAFRIFESNAWRHFHYGKYGRTGADFEWTIPNYFDLDEWPAEPHPDGDYLLYLGRVMPSKGLAHLAALATHTDERIVIVGQEDPGVREKWPHPRLEYRGPVFGSERAELVRNAKAMLMPTRFVEPFGGAGVEGLLCGTPLIASAFGGMTETVQHGENGFLVHSLGDMIEAVRRIPELNRESIATEARARYSLAAVGRQYDKAFRLISDPAQWFTHEGRL